MKNILENGYSTFSPVVIKDRQLHIKSKAIYLFLCAYKNVDGVATVKRATIMNYLAIGSKDTYYKYIKDLTELGYITVTSLKLNGKFYNNQFKINTHIEGINIFQNYGIIARKFMNDKRISLEAKGVYGYLCCYRNSKSENIVYANLSQIKSHLGIATDSRLNRSIKSLIENEYISKEQQKNNNKYTSNTYKLLGYKENITVKESTLDDKEVAESTKKAIAARDLRNKEYKQVIQNENKLKQEIKSYEKNLKDNINYDYVKDQQNKLKQVANEIKNLDEVEAYARMLKVDEQLYDFTNDIINIILRIVFSERDKIKIGKFEYSKIIIKDMFLKLKLEHIEEVLRRYRKALEGSYIKNPSSYIETVLQSVCFDYGLIKIINEQYELYS